MKIAVLADLHLVDISDTVKENVLERALELVKSSDVDAVICAGDMISAAANEALNRLNDKLCALKIPFIYAFGNTENATPAVLEMYKDKNILNTDDCLCAVFPTEKNFSQDVFEKIAALTKKYNTAVIVSHYLPKHFSDTDRKRLAELYENNKNILFVAGHEHYDRFDGKYHVVRGIDPDKVIGGMPAVAFFEYDESLKTFKRENIDCAATVFSENEKNEFRSLLGISGMHDTFKWLDYASFNNIPSFEMRFTAVQDLPADELQSALQKWRNAGGKYLSMHMPDIVWDAEKNVVDLKGADKIADLAVSLQCNRLTIHVPKCSVQLLKNENIRKQFLEGYASIVRKNLLYNIEIGIENMHMTAKDSVDDSRRFGYTPQECREWIEDLRKFCNTDKIGFHFDIGHARNNAPFSSQYPVSSYYAMLGKYINGYHLHQVKVGENGKFLNHQPITEPYGALISYASFGMAWQMNQIAHAPVFIETSSNSDVSYNILKNHFCKE